MIKIHRIREVKTIRAPVSREKTWAKKQEMTERLKQELGRTGNGRA